MAPAPQGPYVPLCPFPGLFYTIIPFVQNEGSREGSIEPDPQVILFCKHSLSPSSDATG